MSTSSPITAAYGDGIGPEIMGACLYVINEAGARIGIEEIEIGEKVYLRGNSAGIEPSAWESLRRTKVFYKAPITTPQGGGCKSLNVTTPKMLGLEKNVRPCLKIITRPGSERICRYAFEYALQHNRKKVTCFAKDNIMKMTDGLFRNTQKVGTKEFGDAVVARLGKTPHTLKAVHYSAASPKKERPADAQKTAAKVTLDGMAETLRSFNGAPGYTLAQGQ
jgi:isocitrate dehydrogenase